MNKISVIIPARLESSRFPNKILFPILGKSMIQRVYEQVIKAKNIDEVYIATDSEIVLQHVKKFGGKGILTSSQHQSGTDRIAEASNKIQSDIIINVQGDEPLIEPKLIESIANTFKNREIYFSSAMTTFQSLEELENRNNVKVITDLNSQAIYFSREIIPFFRDTESINYQNFYKHIGIYGYRKWFLEKFSNLPQTPLEKIEKLEQLRAIENSYKIQMVKTRFQSFGVDTIEDLKKVERILES